MSKSVFFRLFAFFALLSVSILISTFPISWKDWRPASCMPDACFCEAIHPGTVAQPANTWSNFSFVLAGIWIAGARWGTSATKNRNPMLTSPVYALVFGLALVVIGLGSTFYHASMTFAGQFFDVMGMYLLASFILLYNLARAGKLKPRIMPFVYAGLNLLLAYVLIEFPLWRREVFALLILLALGIEYWVQTHQKPVCQRRYLFAAVSSLVVAYIIWILDNSKILCIPDSLLQGHVLWHLLCTLAAWWMYQFYRSEEILTQSHAPQPPR